MSLQYGMNITASNIRKMLEENDKLQSGVRSWRQLFGNTSLGYQAQSDALRSDYSSAIAEAYASNFARRNAIYNAGYNTGATNEMLGASRNDLLAAYNTYIKNYADTASSLYKNYTDNLDTLSTALNERAANFAKIYGSAYDYLSEELYGSTFMRDGEIIDVLQDQGLDWLYLKDESGESTGNIMSWEDASKILFNDEGILTDEGRKFYDQIFNTTSQGWLRPDATNVRSFDKWLSDTYADDKDWSHLRDWWINQDDFNYNLAGTNRGTGMSMLGMESTDQKYSPLEYSRVADFKFNTEFDNKLNIDYINTYDKLFAETEELRKTYSNLMQSGAKTHDVETSRKLNMARTKYEYAVGQLSKTYTKMMSDVSKEYNSALDNLKSLLGTEEYNTFVSTNKDLLNSFDKLISTPTSGISDTTLAEISNNYNDIMNMIKRYLVNRDKSRSGPSGF